jgi:hypothetical protein
MELTFDDVRYGEVFRLQNERLAGFFCKIECDHAISLRNGEQARIFGNERVILAKLLFEVAA